MMLHPSYKELMEKVNSQSEDGENIVNSRYSIVLGTSKRARQIVAADYAQIKRSKDLGEKMTDRDASKKALSIAVEEFDSEKVHILSETAEDYEGYEADEDGKF